MFSAIEDAQNSARGSQYSSRNPLNQTQSSIGGREIESMQKQFQDQMNERVSDLEIQLQEKESQMSKLMQKQEELKFRHAKEIQGYVDERKEKE